ncbi:MAG: AAA family ATPase [Peptoniphilus lacydonensis]|nr:AAA family ATPase [Peptoniphilus lacydonensis]
MEKITIFYGSSKDYRTFLDSKGISLDDAILFPELISQYNETIRASNQGYIDKNNKFYTDEKEYVDYLIIMQNDFSSVLEHVISNFSHIISLAHEIENIILQNPPKRVIESLIASYPEDIFEYEYSKYKNFSIDQIDAINQVMEKEVIGQNQAKFSVLSSLYQLSKKNTNKPIVIHFFGPSGVGKTELAKSISRFFGGELLRIQFSMMQTEEANNYIFGDKHGKDSFARDLLSRESNVVLIDEFDKVHPNFYNAFYEVFDEGVFRDLNYSVDLSNTIFILTSNFESISKMKRKLGLAMASRIEKSIQFFDLDIMSKRKIIQKKYDSIFESLNETERSTITQMGILNWYFDNVEKFINMRELKALIEQDIFDVLTNELLSNLASNSAH